MSYEHSDEVSPGPAIEALQVRRILAATDMSELSSKSLLYALRLGAALKAEIIALHVSDVVLNPPDWGIEIGMSSSGEIESWRQETKRKFDQYLDQLAKSVFLERLSGRSTNGTNFLVSKEQSGGSVFRNGRLVLTVVCYVSYHGSLSRFTDRKNERPWLRKANAGRAQ